MPPPLSRIRNFVSRERAWFAGAISTHRWRIIVGLTIAALAGHWDTPNSPWWRVPGMLMLAVGIIAWPDWRHTWVAPRHSGTD